MFSDGTLLDEPAVDATFRQSEIQNLGVAAVGNKNIGGLDVAVDDSLGMSRVQGVSDLDAE